MTPKKTIALILICNTAFTSLASAAAPYVTADDLEDAQAAQLTEKRPLLGRLLTRIVESGAFDGEEGKQKFYEAIDKGLEANREAALRNLDRLSDEELAGHVARTRKRAMKEGNPAVANWIDSAGKRPELSLRDQIRALHSMERKDAFIKRIHDSVEKAGSVRAAVKDLDYCWGYYPVVTDQIRMGIIVAAVLCVIPGLFVIGVPILAVLLALYPVALVVDYVVIFPFYFFIEVLPCIIESGGAR